MNAATVIGPRSRTRVSSRRSAVSVDSRQSLRTVTNSSALSRQSSSRARRPVAIFCSSRPASAALATFAPLIEDRKSTRLNSSHPSISYAVFCLKKKNNDTIQQHNQQKNLPAHPQRYSPPHHQRT